jgi:general transcription factor 3C polypeptide 6
MFASLLLSETEPKPASDELAPSKENTETPLNSSKEAPLKEVNHLASVQKILKFKPINVEHSQHRAYQHKDKEL